MFYLDFHSLYKPTTKSERMEVRRSLNRDEIMVRRLKHQHGLCFYCADEIDITAHLDHLIPVYYGGTNRPINLVAACKPCNSIKMTDQIEITNPYTIQDYLKLQSVYRKWLKKFKGASPAKKARLKRYAPKRVRLYRAYRADLFKRLN